jgi:hypothetical protein
MTAAPDDTQPPGDAAPDEDVLSIEIGGKTIGANLEAAIAAGHVVRRPDGNLELAGARRRPRSFHNNGKFNRNCSFLNGFMFTHIYDKKAVPLACRDCYKVKVAPDSLRQLIAVKDIALGFPCSAKSNSEVDRPDNQSLYASYFYLLGLDKARAVYKKLRAAIDAHPKLGPAVKMVIKRGCTNYEHACGPSDRYTFDPRLARIEQYFRSRFVGKKPESRHPTKYLDAMLLLDLVQIAYRIGDDTYKDFAGGKIPFPPTITYDPNDPPMVDGDPAPQREEAIGGELSLPARAMDRNYGEAESTKQPQR